MEIHAMENHVSREMTVCNRTFQAFMYNALMAKLGPDQPWGLPNLRTSNMFDNSLTNCLPTVRRPILHYKQG